MATAARKARKSAARIARENLAAVIASGATKRTKAYKSAAQAVEDARYVSPGAGRTRHVTPRRRDYSAQIVESFASDFMPPSARGHRGLDLR